VSHPRGTVLDVTETRTRALRVRLDVNDVQAGLLLRRAGARRVAYNWAVEVLCHNGETWRRQADAGVAKVDRVKVLSHFDLIRRWAGYDDLPACRDLVCRDRVTGETWWAEHPAQLFEAALKDAHENYAKFLRGEARPPRFLSRHRDLPRFRSRSSIKLEPERLSFQRSDGWLRIAHACPEQAAVRASYAVAGPASRR
jgi:putative transposase